MELIHNHNRQATIFPLYPALRSEEQTRDRHEETIFRVCRFLDDMNSAEATRLADELCESFTLMHTSHAE